ncbi:hypothetical protein Tco_0357011 [Tanacetum coccineum]
MAVLDSCPKHNMVAYLEKSEGNAEFHEIIDFLKRSSIHHALTVSPVVSTTFVEQFWTSAKSKTINNVRHITAKVAGKSVSISEASIRMGLEYVSRPSLRRVSQLGACEQIYGSVSVLLKGVYLRGIEVAGVVIFVGLFEALKRHTWFDACAVCGAQTALGAKESVSKHREEVCLKVNISQANHLFDEIPEDSVDHMETENAQDEGRTREMVDEDKEIDENILSTEDVVSTDKEVVSTDKEVVSTDNEKVSTDRPIVSTDGSKISTDRQIEGTDEHIEGTDEHFEGTEEHIEGTKEQFESTDGQRKGTEDHTEEEIAAQATQTPTSTIFGDDETIAKVLLNMSQAKAVSREKEKGVEFKDIEEADKPKPTSTRSLLTAFKD